MNKRVAPALVALLVPGAAAVADRSGSSAVQAKEFPRSIAPKLERILTSKLSGEEPFNDKEVRKLAVTKNWSAWYIADDGIRTQQLETSVGVFDPQNKKCWLWNYVMFIRQSGADRIVYSGPQNLHAIYEIDCALLK
jgi:hypothetical protein